jgi:hypothetical protein
MALQKVKDTMRTTVALDATKLAGAVPTGSLGNAVAADNSITLEKMASGTDGQVITYDASGDPVAIGPGTAGQVLTSAGANLPQTFADAAGGGKVLQCIQDLYTTQTSSTVGSFDMRISSIPQNTHGAEIMTVTITPTATDSTLLVQSLVKLGPGSDGHRGGIMLYQDSTANALDFATEMGQSGGDMYILALQYKKISGSLSQTVFKVRYAPHSGQTIYVNRGNSQATGGGCITSSLIVWEIGA